MQLHQRTRLIVPIVLALLIAPAIPGSAAASSPPKPSPPKPHPARGHKHPHAPKHKAAATPAPAPIVVPAVCPDTALIPAPENVDRVAAATLCLINQQRVAAGKVPLRPNAALNAAATQHSIHMVASDFLGHTSPAGDGPLQRVRANGYIPADRRNAQHALLRAGYAIAENITAAIGDQATPAATVAIWMNSADFRKNILSPTYKDTGIGVAPAAPGLDGTDPGATYTQDFATTI